VRRFPEGSSSREGSYFDGERGCVLKWAAWSTKRREDKNSSQNSRVFGHATNKPAGPVSVLEGERMQRRRTTGEKVRSKVPNRNSICIREEKTENSLKPRPKTSRSENSLRDTWKGVSIREKLTSLGEKGTRGIITSLEAWTFRGKEWRKEPSMRRGEGILRITKPILQKKMKVINLASKSKPEPSSTHQLEKECQLTVDGRAGCLLCMGAIGNFIGVHNRGWYL